MPSGTTNSAAPAKTAQGSGGDSLSRGLTSDEARARLANYGPTAMLDTAIPAWRMALAKFWAPVPWMLEAAIILQTVLHEYVEAAVIAGLLAFNAALGFFQEGRAQATLAALKSRLALSASVLRDGAWKNIPASKLVPGDTVKLSLGGVVAADVKLVTGSILLDQSMLTGESVPIEAGAGFETYAGALVRRGEASAIVTATGARTKFGHTAELVRTAHVVSTQQKTVVRVVRNLALFNGVIIVLLVVYAHAHKMPVGEIIPLVLTALLASIPVALPATFTLAAALGAKALARLGVLPTRLSAVDEAATLDVLCSDKTGTITKNELTLADVRPLEGFTASDVLLFGSLASRAEDRDPIDAAILAKAGGVGVLDTTPSAYKATEFTPFDPVSKRTEAAVEGADSSRFKVSKGAPQAILALTSQNSELAEQVNALVDAFAARGYRALGVARTNQQEVWLYVGLIALFDPPREDSAETIQTAQSMGVDIKMVTGDHTAIAKQTASEVHLGTNIIDATSFADKSDEEAGEIIESADGFAQVFPEHKYRIVELLQQRGHIVGMTGDGVNDAPALKKADAGVAVAGATDAAKSAADIVLMSPGLSVIIDAIKESRKIFQRMTSYALYRIGETIRILTFVTLSIIVFNFYPVTALMIVLLALLNDGTILTIAYDRALYSKTAVSWDMRTVLSVATLFGVLGVTATFGLLYIVERFFFLSPAVVQSIMYLKLSIAGQLMIFVARTRGPFWSFRPANILIGAVICAQTVATLIVVYGVFVAPIGWASALAVWGYALLADFLFTDLVKVQFYKLLDRRSKPPAQYKQPKGVYHE